MSARKRPTEPPDDGPTEVYDSGNFRRELPSPIKAVSMKTPGVRTRQPTPEIKKPKLRAISEVTPLSQAQPKNLGYLAPPRDPNEVRARRIRDYVIWGCVSIILASLIALAVWFAAR